MLITVIKVYFLCFKLSMLPHVTVRNSPPEVFLELNWFSRLRFYTIIHMKWDQQKPDNLLTELTEVNRDPYIWLAQTHFLDPHSSCRATAPLLSVSRHRTQSCISFQPQARPGWWNSLLSPSVPTLSSSQAMTSQLSSVREHSSIRGTCEADFYIQPPAQASYWAWDEESS